MTRTFTIAVLPGDGIGPEITAAACDVLAATCDAFDIALEARHGLLGGIAIDTHGMPLPPETQALVRASDAVLAGAVGGPAWDHLPAAQNPGLGGMLRLRRDLDLYANLRPAASMPGARQPFDVVLVREATGGAYFEQPRGRTGSGDDERAFDTMAYSRRQIRRVIEHAAGVAASRSGRLVSIDKANVLESSRLWREVAIETLAESSLEVEHLFVDAAAYQLARDPGRFDVLVTENMFGDILSDQLAGQVGSLGLLPSAGLGSGPVGLYEPVHGSAPDIAGTDVANPIAMIRSAAMLLRHSARRDDAATAVEHACDALLAQGIGTADLALPTVIGTREAGERIAAGIERTA